ncbi:MAG TPA: SCO family protein [Lacunisphaera sp.]|jgi:protein SCO1/2
MKPRLILLVLMVAAVPCLRAAFVPGVSFEQRLGEMLPLDVHFKDTDGKEQVLGNWFQGKPVVLWFGYARCPQLCSVVSEGMVASLRELEPTAGRDFDVIMVSIDPAEPSSDSAHSRNEAVGHYGRREASAGWHYLTGTTDAIKRTADAAGFHFTYDPRSKLYAHPSGFLVVTPQGRISAYFPGVDFSPKEVAAAISRARHNGIGEKVVDLLLVCFRGEGISGPYGLLIWRILSIAVVLTVTSLASGIGRMLWLERKALRQQGNGEGA